MTNSLPIPDPVAESAFPVRWLPALAIAAGIELALIGLALGAHSAPVSVDQPVKVARLLAVADEPSLPAPAPAPAPKKAEPPKPAAKTAPSPAPRQPAADTAAVAPTSSSNDNPSKDVQPNVLPAVSKGAAPATPPKPEKPAGVRRGIVPLLRIEPEYPARALAANTEGVVIAHVTIEKDGSVSAVNIVSAQPPKIFDQAATRALLRWKFQQNDGGVIGEVELHFNLN